MLRGCSGLDDPVEVMPIPDTPAMPAVGLAWGILQLDIPRAGAGGLLCVLGLLYPCDVGAHGVSSLGNSWFGDGVG